MDKSVYELLVKLTELAVTGKEKMAEEAQGAEDRREVAEAEATIIIAQYYVNEYDELYRGGHLS